MTEIGPLGITFAGKAHAGDAVEGEATVEGFGVVVRVIPLSLLNPSVQSLSHATPRHDLVEENVAVGGKQTAIGGRAVVRIGNIGIVITGDKPNGRDLALEKGFNLGELGRGHARLVVAGVAVEPQGAHPAEHGDQLIQRGEAARGIAEVEIGQNAQHGRSRANGSDREGQSRTIGLVRGAELR